MNESPVVCKPTPWFLFRAAAVLVMFGVFSVLFYLDGSTGYRKKNLGYYTHATFKKAHDDFARMNAGGELTPDEWKEYTEGQSVSLPKDPSVLPAGLKLPVPWPAILSDYEKMKPLDWHRLWLDYTAKEKMSSNPPERPYDAGKIFEQWVVFWICVTLVMAAAFFLVRTVRRSIRADDDGVTGADGKTVAYGDMQRLDLRKWDTKGLAFIEYDGAGGKGRMRIDGLTYGGFKKEQGEPAEQLMERIRSRFSGEILEYVSISDGMESPDGVASGASDAEVRP